VAGQQAVGAESAEDGIDGAFLEERLALVRLLQPFGNFVAIEVFGGLVEDGEQYEGDEAGIEVFLEFAGVAFVRAAGVYRMLLVDFAPLCPGCAEN
jgi:hypothetical protein